MSVELCPCHGEPWVQEANRRLCRVKKRERVRRYADAHREEERRRWRAHSRQNAQRKRETSRAWREANAGAGSTRVSWRSMLQRCRNPNPKDRPYYSGRGITVCDRWNPRAGGSFANFLADMGERPEGRTLDRIDPNGNYEPANCRWATPQEQRGNRREQVPA